MAATASAQTVFVPSTHWVYDFLDRMETKRLLPVVLAGTKPMTRAAIAGHLEQLQSRRGLLSNTEIDQLDYLLFEFQEHVSEKSSHKTRLKKITELSWTKNWWPNWLYPAGRHLLEIDAGPLTMNLDPILYRSRLVANDDTLSARERVNMDTNGFLLWGTVGPYVGYYTDVRDTREWGTREYPSGTTSWNGVGFAVGNRQQVYHDETDAYFTFQKDWFLVQYGKDKNKWGTGYFDQLALSENATSYDLLKFQLRFDRITYTTFVGWLKHYTPDYFTGGTLNKMLAAHRFEASPKPWIDIGVHEMIVYKDRTFEPAYFNPVMFFRSAEHYLGDRDNAFMGLDVELKVIPNTKLYGELLLDDLTTGKLGTGFYGNKNAYMAGLLHVDLFKIKNLDVRLEYSRLRPFIYSHKFHITNYQHFATGLGHADGPHSQGITIALLYRPHRRLYMGFMGEQSERYENYDDQNIGGDIDRPHQQGDPLYIKFGDGQKYVNTCANFFIHYEFLRNLFFTFDYSYTIRMEQKEPKENRRETSLKISFNFQ